MEIFETHNPTVCVISIVQRLVDICENNWDEIKYTNVEIVNKISRICSARNIYCIHISTDYVFDGTKAPYYPASLPNPLQNYGISKLLSEYKVMNNMHDDHYVIIRVPVLYTNKSRTLEENAVTLIGKKVLDRTGTFKEDNYSLRRPVFIPDFCLFLLDVILNTPKFLGVYHYYNPHDSYTKYEISQLIGKILQKSADHILPMNEPPDDGVDRPIDTQLLDQKYDVSNYKTTCLVEGLKLCFEKIYHPPIYNGGCLPTDLFFLLDCDGTLLDSDLVHLEAYSEAARELDVDVSSMNLDVLLLTTVDEYLQDKVGNKCIIERIKARKKEIIKSMEVGLIPGAEKLIDFIHKNNVNHCVVTNTSLSTIESFKSKCPSLQKLSNWITREDYENPKPHSECYEKALLRHHTNEAYVVGFENSWAGYQSLKNATTIIYMMHNRKCPALYEKMKKEDVYIIKNYYDL
jgi:dTDP-4-dehydrorhamnose reductase